jgi:predicted kinase
VAKPKYTREEDGRIRSRGHALGGARMARRILMEDPSFGERGTPFELREQIVALVRHHGLPANLLDKPDPERALIAAAVAVRCDLLCVLAEADARGRICAQPDDAPQRVKLFREYAQECGCLSGPYCFASDYSRWHYFRTPAAPPTVQVYDPCEFEVVMMSGLPAAGKDTWVKANAGERPVISLDHLRRDMDVDAADDQGEVIQAAKEIAKTHLRAKRTFVWNATNTTRFLREGLVELFAAYGARVRIIYCEAPLSVVRERNAQRERPVPAQVIDQLVDHLDVPDLTEAVRVECMV